MNNEKKSQSIPVVQSEPNGKVLELVPNNKLWERQTDGKTIESDQAFEAWELYRSLKEQRQGSLREVARQLGKSNALIERWSKRWYWQRRWNAYEQHLAMLDQREKVKATRLRAEKWATRRVDIREGGFAVGDKLLNRAMTLLELPVTNKRIEKKVVAEYAGQVIDTVTILEFQQHPRDARLFAETALKLMRLSADMTTENLGLLDENLNLDDMSVEELEAYAARFAAIRRGVIEETGEVI